MRVVFVSQVYADPLLPYLRGNSKQGLDYAAHNLGTAILTGLIKNNQKYFHISHPNVGSYPFRFRKFRVNGFWDESNDFESIPFINLSVLKSHSISHNVYNSLKKHLGNDDVLLLYNFEALDAVYKIKLEKPKLKVVMIVTDLPEYMDVGSGMFSKLVKLRRKISNNKFYKHLSCVDGFVFLAKPMSERINYFNKPFIVMEGIYNDREPLLEIKGKENKNIIFYTGNLSYRYGIKELLLAFSKIPDEDFELWLRGTGEAEDEIRKISEQDRRIVMLPPLSREELQRRQQQASILINPVKRTQEFTRFFFPSKTLEYLVSGTPTLMNKLDCIPSEYNDFLFYLKDETVDGILTSIINIVESDKNDLLTRGIKARDFILREKNPAIQVGKILDFIDRIRTI